MEEIGPVLVAEEEGVDAKGLGVAKLVEKEEDGLVEPKVEGMVAGVGTKAKDEGAGNPGVVVAGVVVELAVGIVDGLGLVVLEVVVGAPKGLGADMVDCVEADSGAEKADAEVRAEPKGTEGAAVEVGANGLEEDGKVIEEEAEVVAGVEEEVAEGVEPEKTERVDVVVGRKEV